MSETTLTTLPDITGQFPAPQAELDPANVTAITNIVTQQNANNASLRADINAKATFPVVSSQLDPATIQYAAVALSNADLLALHATPKVLVAAPGAGKMLEFVSAFLEYVYAAAFTIGSAGNMTVKYKSDASGPAASGNLAATGFLDQTATTVASLLPAALAAVAATTPVNQPLVLTVASADVTGGAGTTGIVQIAYRVHSGL